MINQTGQYDFERHAKQNVKDSVFTNLFKDPEYTIQLYRALHPEDTVSTKDDVRILTLENILLNQPYNDLGFSVSGHMLIFVEAQSTWSYNILVRGLLYMAQTIQVYLMETEQNIYGSRKVSVPSPEFYVLYTGERKDHPDRISLKEEFFKESYCAIDVTASVIYDGKEGDIINQYINFTRIYQKQYKLYGRTQKAVLETIRICKNENILKTYLTDREKEVVDIMMWLFNQEYATDAYVREQREEAKAEGKAEGARETARKLYSKGMLPEEIAGLVDYGVETICQWLGISSASYNTKA